jgi:uncharacterized damage-inducible protein DinB
MEITSTPLSKEVIRRVWTPSPIGLLELWQHEAPRTARTFRIFSDEDLDYRPRPNDRSVAQVMQHIISSYLLTHHWLVHESSDDFRRVALPQNVTIAATLLISAQHELFELLRAASDESFRVEIRPFGVRESRGVMALGMLKHELHHRGEMYSLARACGHTPPNLYDPIAKG